MKGSFVFLYNSSRMWRGGRTYIRNFQKSLLLVQNIKVELIDIREAIPKSNFLRSVYLSAKLQRELVDKYDFIFIHGLIPISHSRIILWIPDILHIHRPFDLAFRNLVNRKLYYWFVSKLNIRLLTSSYFQAKEIEKKYSKSCLVYRFGVEGIYSRSESKRKIKNLVFSPNAFWQHKMQTDILKLAAANPNYTFVLCGPKMLSKKHSGWKEFSRLYGENRLDNVHYVGELGPSLFQYFWQRSELICTMSQYEGWNTTIEMAKRDSKAILLSDIEVHREQMENYPYYQFLKADTVIEGFTLGNFAYHDYFFKNLMSFVKSI